MGRARSAERVRNCRPSVLSNPDLRKDIPQIDLLAGMSSEQLEELFVAAFGLSEKGGDADHYRMADRRSARAMSQLIHNPCQSISEIALNPLVQHQAEGFIGKLEELAFVKALDAVGGLDLGTVVRDGGCVYVVGSTRMSRVINAQRLLLVRLIQLAETRDRVAGPVRPICVFLDELKYRISRPALEGLGTARDKGMHFILAHQSISDFERLPRRLGW